ncbi:MAG: hypothetical protein AABY22_36420, partial [Nanoarchaeota archaeon]
TSIGDLIPYCLYLELTARFIAILDKLALSIARLVRKISLAGKCGNMLRVIMKWAQGSCIIVIMTNLYLNAPP